MFIENGVHLCIFYDVFDVGVYAGSSFIEVSHLYMLGISPLPLLIITSRCWIVFVVIYPTSLSLLNSELFCRSYGSSGFICIPLFSVVFQWHASGSTAGAHGSTAGYFRGSAAWGFPERATLCCRSAIHGSRAAVAL